MTELIERHAGDGGVVVAEDHLDHAEHEHHEARGILKWLTSTDHKVIGLSYTITSLVMFVLAGALAELIRIQLTEPNNTFVSLAQFDQLFTMHGSLMVYLFVGPFAFGGLANIIVPLQIGAPDMAFPRLNALSYWLYLSGSLTMLLGFFVAGGPADFGWTLYAPLSNAIYSPGVGPDLFIAALLLTGFSAIFTGVNICGTVFYLRAPGMTMFRMPIFTWNMLVVGILILLAFPVLTAGLIMLYCDRHFGTHIFTVHGGGVPVLWQHIFWFWGHPEVYILALPFFGIVTDVIAAFSRKPVFGYRTMVFATITIAALSLGVWAHHMFTTGVVLLPFFSIMSLLIAVPTGIKIFNWVGTMWGGHVRWSAAMLFAIGFVITFLLGGLTGIYLASPPLDFFTHDTYFVVAHFHSVVLALVMGGMAGIYYWCPKITGYLLNEALGKWQFWTFFLGANLMVMPQYWLGLLGMPRRVATYIHNPEWVTLNRWATAGALVMGLSTVFFLVNVAYSWYKRVPAGDNPWDAQTLEWFTTSPPPHHNYYALPPIRSERPTWDYHHPGAPALVHGHHEAPDDAELVRT
ncbi:MAG TPA: cbb3-type cytochrome c oxidase subunit I [Acidimicrobiales bacterium]|nr:cbb3-type cytochrome c oxidase subunit I [Acidimicrobiales bacterium]